jgi:hypothetical protein
MIPSDRWSGSGRVATVKEGIGESGLTESKREPVRTVSPVRSQVLGKDFPQGIDHLVLLGVRHIRV